MSRSFPSFLIATLILALAFSPARAYPGPCLDDQSSDLPQDVFHIVQRGETLFSIAQRYGSTVDALAHANGLTDPTRIYTGQRLTVPGGRLEIDPESTSPYVVHTGDTLLSIARRYATSWRALAQVNGMISPAVLYAGQIILVPLVEGSLEGRQGMLHVVDPSETLFQIASRYDVSPWSVINANHPLNPALVYPGQQLLIPGEGSSWLPAPFAYVDVYPVPVSQGETLICTVRTAESVTLGGRLFEQDLRFTEENGVYYGLAGVHVFTEPGLYELTLSATHEDGQTMEITADVVVEAGGFGYERIPAAPSMLDPAIVAAESERLDTLRTTFTESRDWTGPFQRPCGGSVSSYFGTHRAYNEGPYTSYHGGVDLRGPTGTPVYAPAGGTVVMAEPLTVRGNAVLLDHGWGVLTGYWHLSAIEVQVGQEVKQGDLIARIGSTGLSTGAHLHWEMWVSGVNVDPLQWLESFYAWPDPAGASQGSSIPRQSERSAWAASARGGGLSRFGP